MSQILSNDRYFMRFLGWKLWKYHLQQEYLKKTTEREYQKDHLVFWKELAVQAKKEQPQNF